ncbi:hypothetical protein L0P75_16195, partial [Faecalibacillus intestinalis]|nr:hypothetical protein [Faecalibacillus intestinalis]
MYFLDMSMQKDYIKKYKWLIDQAPIIIEKEYKDFVSKIDKGKNEQYFYSREDDFAYDNYLYQNQ